MTEEFQECARIANELLTAVDAVADRSRDLQIAPLAGLEWYELLRRKLVPQLTDEAYLVVAVVGGTNLGKSVIFNHLAGESASSTSPMASGTKHPVCLMSEDFIGRHPVAEIFPGFQLTEWSETGALEEADEHRLYCRNSQAIPSNLLLLDTPDIDSDAPVNWERAKNIRQAADVLIAVLTQQKYNDAAVKAFFRQAASEDKAVVIVFNQCLLPEDEEFWPQWIGTFCAETGVNPELVYLAPNDRRAAEEIRLPFFERSWPPRGDAVGERDREPRNLRDDLSRLRFHDVKLRSLLGSIHCVLDQVSGASSYLARVVEASGRYQSAIELLAEDRLVKSDHWPTLPNRLMMNAIRAWWQQHREGFSRTVHGLYNKLGQGVSWPFQTVRKKLKGPPPDPFEEFLKCELDAWLEVVGHTYERLQVLAELGNPILRDRLTGLLRGRSREQLVGILRQQHSQIDIQQDLQDLVDSEMTRFESESPKQYRTLKYFDQASAVVRPATSVALFVSGLGPAGDVAGQMVSEHLIQVALEATGGTVAVAVGDTAATTGLGYIEAKFRGMQNAFTVSRTQILKETLDQYLLGGLMSQLSSAAMLQNSDEIKSVIELLDELAGQLTA